MDTHNERLKRLGDNYDFLHLLQRCHRKQRKALLKSASKEQIRLIYECIQNVLYNKEIFLDPDTKTKLKPKRELLCMLCNPKSCKTWTDRRDVIVQKGGFLPALLAPVLGIAASLIGDLITK